MNSTYAQKSSTVQKAADTKAASVLDSSAQSESLQRKADMANNAAQRAESPRPNNTGMPDNLKAGIESLSGFSMDDVRVHYNSSKPATVQALAYTQGTDIHVAPGQEKCLPHEAWHVAQQMAGRVSPTTNINGMPVNDNAALEHEADVMGEKAVSLRKLAGVNFINGKEQNLAVQRMASYNPNMPSETRQEEGNSDLAVFFGRELGTVRPHNVARKVDQYKKEMLTYIAHCIQEKGKYGPHISVVITGGVWFIAINSDYASENRICNLRKDSFDVKQEIIEKWNALNSCDAFKNSIVGQSDPNDEIAKKQAVYIVYRWAGKNKGIVVEHNKKQTSNVGVMHGEMKTIDFLNNVMFDKKNAFLKAASFFSESKKYFSEDSDAFKHIFDAEVKVHRALFYADEAQIAIKAAVDAEEKDKVESDAENKAAVAVSRAYDCAKDALDAANKSVSIVARIPERVDVYYKLQDASTIIDFQIKSYVGHSGIIRVGGTKTACFDCGYEMNLHEMSGRNSASKTLPVHKDGVHRAFKVGPKKIVTMTLNCGNGFPSWIYPQETQETGKSDGMLEKPGLDSHDSLQDQDYNELYIVFNSLNLKNGEGDTQKDVKMRITDSMKKVLGKRSADDYENDLSVWKSNEDNLKILKILEKLNVTDSLKIKDWFVRDLEILYNRKFQNENDPFPNIPNDSGEIVKIMVENLRNDAKNLINFERLVVRRLSLNVVEKEKLRGV